MSSWWSNVTQKVKNWWKSSDDERDAYSGMVHIRDENARIGFSKFRDRLAAGILFALGFAFCFFAIELSYSEVLGFPSRGNSLRPDPEKAIAGMHYL